jgi:predicted dehydrogenase
MTDIVRWGILGTGKIAENFVVDLPLAPGAELVAVGSRSAAAAEAFGLRHGIPHRHDSYQALAGDPDIDVVYVATPHSLHAANSQLCLKSGKHVLCEKPFTINAREAEDVIRLSRARSLFVMEAMWTRFLPASRHVVDLLQERALGDILLLAADFGMRFTFNPKSRLFDPALGGGALLDLGVYPISLASMVFGPPQHMTSTAIVGQTGVDEQAGIVLEYEGGRLAVLYTSMRATTPDEATILGSAGSLRIHAPMHSPADLTLVRNDGDEQRWSFPLEGNGLHYQAIEVMDCIREGKTESDVMPLDESLSIMRTMDDLRAQWGLRYPMETSG